MTKKLTAGASALATVRNLATPGSPTYPTLAELNVALTFLEGLVAPVSFAPGDRVRYIKKRGDWPYGEEHIITEASLDGDEVSYATSSGAWFTFEDFELIERATKASIDKAMSSMNTDDEDED